MSNKTLNTWYVRDAQGNVLAEYQRPSYVSAASLFLKEQYLYGSSRLGIRNESLNLTSYGKTPDDTLKNNLGLKSFEGSNHLGNVLTVVNEKKILDNGSDVSGNSLVDYYTAKVTSVTDYGIWGDQLPQRNANSTSYEHGFNGKLNDDEIIGNGRFQDYGMRMYRPDLGRFISVDPIAQSYPFYSPFIFSGDNPIMNIDIDGLENNQAVKPNEPLKPKLSNIDVKAIFSEASKKRAEKIDAKMAEIKKAIHLNAELKEKLTPFINQLIFNKIEFDNEGKPVVRTPEQQRELDLKLAIEIANYLKDKAIGKATDKVMETVIEKTFKVSAEVASKLTSVIGIIFESSEFGKADQPNNIYRIKAAIEAAEIFYLIQKVRIVTDFAIDEIVSGKPQPKTLVENPIIKEKPLINKQDNTKVNANTPDSKNDNKKPEKEKESKNSERKGSSSSGS